MRISIQAEKITQIEDRLRSLKDAKEKHELDKERKTCDPRFA